MKRKITGLISVFFVIYSAQAELPARFDARDQELITAVKDQSELGACWAFSGTSLLETGYIQAGLGTTLNTDFSEWQMANYAHPQSWNDYIAPYINSSADWGSYDADSLYYAQAQFSSVFATETSAPYPLQAIADSQDLTLLIPRQTTPSISSAVVSTYGIAAAGLPDTGVLSATDVTLVKTKIQEFGSAAIGMDWSSSAITKIDDKQFVYNATGSSSSDEGHSVTIVGWDDDVATGDGTTGAFIVKDSFGDDLGNGGYYYLAYNSYVGDAGVTWLEVSDASHLTSAYSTLPALDGADKNYQDGFYSYSVSAAMKIELNHLSSASDTLLSVGLLGEEGDTYRLSFYDGDEVGSVDQLTADYLLYEIDQTMETSGFQMFDLDDAVDVSSVDNLWLIYGNAGDGGSVVLYEYADGALTEDLSYTFSDGMWKGATESNTLAGVNLYMIPEPAILVLISMTGAGFVFIRRIFL